MKTMRWALVALVLVAVAAVGTKPWRYRWAFGQDLGAARSADWKDKPCTRELARAMYGPAADTGVVSKQGNRYMYPGAPGHSYYVHGFHTRAGCEAARAALGDAQWDQSSR